MKFVYSSAPQEIKDLADEYLGQGELKRLMSARRDFFIVLKLDQGVVVGFVVYSKDKDRGFLDAVVIRQEYILDSWQLKSVLSKSIKGLLNLGCKSVLYSPCETLPENPLNEITPKLLVHSFGFHVLQESASDNGWIFRA